MWLVDCVNANDFGGTPSDVALAPNGDIVVCGNFSGFSPSSDGWVHRFDANGQPLSGFGEFGLPLPDPDADPDPCTANGPWTFGAGRLVADPGGGAILVAGAHGPGRLVSRGPTVEKDRDTVAPTAATHADPHRDVLPEPKHTLAGVCDLLRANVIEQA